MNASQIEILLIEDDVDDAELAIHSLRKNNLINNLVHIDDGEKALDFLYSGENKKPKIILLDLRMPRVDGIQILKKLKGDSDMSDIPVIALVSSKESGRKYVESFGVKADAYLLKPIEFNKFCAAVSEMGLAWKFVDAGT